MVLVAHEFASFTQSPLQYFGFVQYLRCMLIWYCYMCLCVCAHCRTETVLVPRRLACHLRATSDGINSGERVSGYVAVSAADVDVGVTVR
jgi:hypothetical protein